MAEVPERPAGRLPDSVRQEVRAVGGFAYGVIGADIHVFGDGTPVYLLLAHRPAPAGHDPEHTRWLRDQPSRMLGTRAGTVPFTGRAAELAELTAWRDSAAGRAVRLLHGPGGQGKSRLAQRLADDSAARGWLVADAVHATDTHPPAEGSQDLRTEGRAGVLIMVEYADRWPSAHLNWLFRNGLLDAPVPVRVLLVARSPEGWPALRAQLARAGRAIGTSDQPLAALPEADGSRRAMFEAARTGFAERYPGVPDPDGIPPPLPLDDPAFGLTLTVHLAALVAVDARARHRETPGEIAGLTTYLLDREFDNWTRLHDNGTLATPVRALARTVLAAVLTGPVRRERAAALLPRLFLPEPAERILADHAVLYPGERPGAGVLHPLLPDRLAEDYLALCLPGSPVTGHPTDLWTVTAIPALLDRWTGHPPPYTPRALAFLTAAAERWPHVGERVLFPLLRRDPRLAVDAGGAVLSSLAALPGLDPAVLSAVGAVLPSGTQAYLDVGAADFTERFTDQRLAGAPEPVAAVLHALRSMSRGRAGRPEEALEDARAAVTRLRADGHGGRPLAAMLTQLGESLRLCERAGEAVPVCRDAVERYRRLDDPPGLATALSALSLALYDDGDPQRALAVSDEECAVHERIAAGDPAAAFDSLPSRLVSAHHRALMLFATGDREGGIASAEYAADGLRQFARLDPGAHELALTRALSRLGDLLWRAERRDEAAAALAESLVIHRRLTGARPAERPRLALAAARLGALLSDLDRPARAAEHYTEAVGLFRALTAEDPERWMLHLTSVLHHLRALDPPGAEWGSRREIDRAAKRLAARGEWSALWELTLAVPVADAVRLARRFPGGVLGRLRPAARRWRPPDEAGRAALATLRRTRPARVPEAPPAVLLPDAVDDPRQLSFAPGVPLLALAGGPANSTLDVIDLTTRERRTLTAGQAKHTSLACLPDGSVAAVRRTPRGWELVRYEHGTVRLLAAGEQLRGARVVATAEGPVTGLRAAPAALAGGRPVDLGRFGLRRGHLLAANAGGTRLALSDGTRLVLTDASLTTLLASAPVPDYHGEAAELVFCGPDELVTIGTGGGHICVWQAMDGRLVTANRSPGPVPLCRLFAVPAWRAIGGRRIGGVQPLFHDSVTLAPRELPMPFADGFTPVVASSADGRHIAYGRLGSGRARGVVTALSVQDLGHPAAMLRRPAAVLTDADLAAAESAPGTASPVGAEVLGAARAVLAARISAAPAPVSRDEEPEEDDPSIRLDASLIRRQQQKIARAESAEDEVRERGNLAAMVHAAALAAGPGHRLMERAVGQYEDVVRASTAVLGPGHPETLGRLDNLGAVLLDAGRPMAAAEVLERALAGRERALGEDHADTAETRFRLADVHRRSGAPARAIPLMERAVPATVPAAVRRERRSALCETLVEAGEYAPALELGGELLAETVELHGPGHLEEFVRSDGLAVIHHGMGAPELAIPYYERAVEGLTAVLGADHARTLPRLARLAVAHAECGAFDTALEVAGRVLAARERTLGRDAAETLEWRREMASMLTAAGRCAEAAEVLAGAAGRAE
ncbi:tetratricopeptide repeat protein [Streptomyces sp. CAU 1734]|uniref:tetratricopeptide repeat protein n=1 Tax=Streptomyces sp. CAU 1734 TaxID=3140360 RepID=UPI003261B867